MPTYHALPVDVQRELRDIYYNETSAADLADLLNATFAQYQTVNAQRAHVISRRLAMVNRVRDLEARVSQLREPKLPVNDGSREYWIARFAVALAKSQNSIYLMLKQAHEELAELNRQYQDSFETVRQARDRWEFAASLERLIHSAGFALASLRVEVKSTDELEAKIASQQDKILELEEEGETARAYNDLLMGRTRKEQEDIDV